MAMDKGEKRKDVATRLPTLAPEIMAVGHECPHESLEEEGGGERPRIARATTCGRSGPYIPNLKQMAVGPERPRESQKEEGGDERTRSGDEKSERKEETGKADKSDATMGQGNEIV